MSQPDILVVLPTLGTRNALLVEALASVDEQRRDVSLTLAVVTPPDATEARELATRWGAVIVDDPGGGMSEAMNAGRRVATTERFTIWLGDDDRYLPGGLARLVQLMGTTDRTVVAYGACHYVDPVGRILWTSKAGTWAAKIIGFGPNLIPHPAALIRIDALNAVGGYDPNLKLVMDLDVFMKLKKRGIFRATTTPVAVFGWQPDSLTVSSRLASEREARHVKLSYLSKWLRPMAWLWEWPVAWASRSAARRLTRRQNPTARGSLG